MILTETLPPRSALYVPASKPRAVEKARDLPADMVILDLEDAVPAGMKDEARQTAAAAVAGGFAAPLVAIRINGPDNSGHAADLLAIRDCGCDLVVLPKVEAPSAIEDLAAKIGRPILAMIETPRGVLGAPRIAESEGLAGLIAGTNDLANALQLPPGAGRDGLTLSLQAIVLAARAAGLWALDGVFNDLADPVAFEAECRTGRALGFDGKTLIHPDQIAIANAAFSPGEAELEEARALIAAASGGAERFRDRMIETMHVEMARRLLRRAGQV